MSRSWHSTVCWLCAGIGVFWALVAIPLLGWVPVVLPLVSIPLAVILGVRRYGARAAWFYWLAAMVISTTFENIGVMTGFPFGHYHYTVSPKLFFVPWFIAPIYASIGFVCWIVASTLLGDADRRLGRLSNVAVLPLVAGAVMTMWDLVTDAMASTVGHMWIWEQGGRYFGVPETNFIGWWFVTYVFFQCFALYLRFARTPVAEPRASFETVPPIVFYGAMGLSVLAGFAVGRDRLVTDAAGVVWHLTGIQGPMAIVTVFTMMFVTLLALQRASERSSASLAGEQAVEGRLVVRARGREDDEREAARSLDGER